jgi:hypothetical protein
MNIELLEVENIHNFAVNEIGKLEGLPQIGYVADIILRRISYEQITGNLEPMPGQNEIFDEEKKEVDRISHELESELSKWK